MMESHRDEIAKLESLYASNPEGRVFTHLAEACRKAGQLERALEILEEGLRRHPDYASAHVVLGRVLLDTGETARASEEFRRVLELDRHNLVALRSLGDLAAAESRTEEALYYYGELAVLDPNDGAIQEEIRRLRSLSDGPGMAASAGTATAEPADAGATVATDAGSSAWGTEAEAAEAEAAAASYGHEPVETEATGIGSGEVPAEVEPMAGLEGAPEAEFAPGLEAALAGLETGTFADAPTDEETPAESAGPDASAEAEESDYPPPEPLEGIEASGMADGVEAAASEPPAATWPELTSVDLTPAAGPDAAPAEAATEEAPETSPDAVEAAAGLEAGPEATGEDTTATDEMAAPAAEAEAPAAEAEAEAPAGEAETPAVEGRWTGTPVPEEMLDRKPDLGDTGEWIPAERWEWMTSSAGAKPAEAEEEAPPAEPAETPDAFEGLADAEETGTEEAAPDWATPTSDWEPETPAWSPPAEAEAAAEPTPEAEPADAEAASGYTVFSSEVVSWSEESTEVESESVFGYEADEDDSGDQVITETLAEIYAAQGLHDRAAAVYRRLLSQRPNDERLQARLHELEHTTPWTREGAAAAESAEPAEAAGSSEEAWLERVESAWTGGEGAVGAADSLYAWPAPAAEEPSGNRVGDYFRNLLAWRPSGRSAAAGGDAGMDDANPESEFDTWFGSPQQEGPGDGARRAEGDEDLEMFRSWLKSLKK